MSRGRPRILLDALAGVLGALPDAQLLFVGEGPDEQRLRERVTDLALDEHVSFFPFTTEPVYVFETIDLLALRLAGRQLSELG